VGFAVTILSPPDSEPVPLDGPGSLKNWLRVDIPDDDDLIASLGRAARRMIERAFDVALVTQTLQLTIDRFPIPGNPYLWQQYSWGFWACRIPMLQLTGSWWPERAAIWLPRPPLQSVVAVNYIAQDQTNKTADPSTYLVDNQRMPGRLTPAVGEYWPIVSPQMNAANIQYVAGYGAPNDVPDTIITAIKLAVAGWYENRLDAGKLPDAAIDLCVSEWGAEYY
jgi:hypothetical protein